MKTITVTTLYWRMLKGRVLIEISAISKIVYAHSPAALNITKSVCAQRRNSLTGQRRRGGLERKDKYLNCETDCPPEWNSDVFVDGHTQVIITTMCDASRWCSRFRYICSRSSAEDPSLRSWQHYSRWEVHRIYYLYPDSQNSNNAFCRFCHRHLFCNVMSVVSPENGGGKEQNECIIITNLPSII